MNAHTVIPPVAGPAEQRALDAVAARQIERINYVERYTAERQRNERVISWRQLAHIATLGAELAARGEEFGWQYTGMFAIHMAKAFAIDVHPELADLAAGVQAANDAALQQAAEIEALSNEIDRRGAR